MKSKSEMMRMSHNMRMTAEALKLTGAEESDVMLYMCGCVTLMWAAGETETEGPNIPGVFTDEEADMFGELMDHVKPEMCREAAAAFMVARGHMNVGEEDDNEADEG